MSELKCYEQYGAWRPLAAGSWECCNDMSQGYSWRDRIGSQVRILHISLRADIVWGNAVASRNVLRTMIFIDTQPNGVTATMAEMFWVPAAAIYLEWPQPIYWLYKDRFLPIYDKAWSSSLSYGGAAVGGDKYSHIEFEKDVDFVTNYKGNAGTIADISNNAVMLFAYCSDAVTGANTPYFNWWSRVLYTDT